MLVHMSIDSAPVKTRAITVRLPEEVIDQLDAWRRLQQLVDGINLNRTQAIEMAVTDMLRQAPQAFAGRDVLGGIQADLQLLGVPGGGAGVPQ